MDTRTGGRPHLGDIARGLIDSRVSGVDFWDTDAGRRLLEWQRRGEAPGTPEPADRESAAEAGRRRPSWDRLRRTGRRGRG